MPLRLGLLLAALALGAPLGAAASAPPAAAGNSPAALVTRALPDLWSGPRATGRAAAAQPANQRGADIVELYHLRYEEVAADGLSRQVIQRVFYIANPVGAQTFDGDDFWYDSSRWSFHLWRGTVRHADGAWAAPIADAGDDDPHGLGNRARGLTLPTLAAGDVINIVYVLEPVAPTTWDVLGPGYLGDLFAFEGAYPAERVIYVLRSRQPLAVRGVGLPATSPVGQPDGWRCWTWRAGPLAAYWPENEGPSITDVSPYVQTGSFADWGALVAWYHRRLAERAALSPTFRARLTALVPAKPTALATVAAVWAYLAAHLDYEGAETGVHGFLPAAPEQVFAAGQGDCKDGALLMAAWLRADGVPADLALVRTWKMGAVSDGAATIAAFDHAILYVPELNLWLDTTAPNLGVGELPAADQGGLALVVASGQQRLRRIPVASAAANATWRDVRLAPHGSSQWEMSASIVATGTAGDNWRRQLYAEHDAALAHWLDRYFPAARLLSAHTEAGAGAVRLRFRALIARGALASALTPFPGRYAVELAAERERQEPKRLPVRWQITDHWTLPVARCPATVAAADPLASAFGSLTVARHCAAGLLTTITTLTQAATEIAPGQYPRFRAFWRAVDGRLHPAPAPAPAVLAREQPAPFALSPAAK